MPYLVSRDWNFKKLNQPAEEKMSKTNEELRRQYDEQGLPYIVDKGEVILVEFVEEEELPRKRVKVSRPNIDEALKNFDNDVFAGVL
jgi:hypothetical protein